MLDAGAQTTRSYRTERTPAQGDGRPTKTSQGVHRPTSYHDLLDGARDNRRTKTMTNGQRLDSDYKTETSHIAPFRRLPMQSRTIRNYP